MDKLTIDRRIWLRGEGSEKSCLLRKSDNKQCCIGILLEANGISSEELAQWPAVKNYNNGTHVTVPEHLHWLLEDNTDDSITMSSFYSMNDYPFYSNEYREAELTRMFAEKGIEVEFIN